MPNIWQQRISNSTKMYDAWASRFKCSILEDYYEGFHWRNKGSGQDVNYSPYTLNLFYSTIKTKLASFLFKRPSYIIGPAPGSSDWNQDFALQSSTLKQDVLNTIIHNPHLNFTKHLKLAALDSFFRFGIVEIGYAADWRNPQKEDPLLKSWEDPNISEAKDKVLDANEIPFNERFYIKRIPAKKFRIAVSEASDLEEHEWCGYDEYFYTKALKNTKGVKWPDITNNSYLSNDVFSGVLGHTDLNNTSPEFVRLIQSGSVSRCWHIFDQIAHKRLLFLDNHFDEPLFETECEHLPIIDIRWDDRLEGFYPIPPCFQWLSPQNEINEAREQMRSFRRRFTRKWQSLKGAVDQEEKDKFASGPDGIIIEVNQPDAIKPIQNPEIGATAEHALIIAKDDFQTVAGSSDVRQSDRETATKSRILDLRSQIRESSEQIDFSDFACRIGREVLCQAQEKLSDGMWVKYTTDPGEDVFQDMQIKAPIYKWIGAQQIDDGYDFTIEVDIQNATPAAMQQAQEAFITFCSLLVKFPFIVMSPILIREAAYRCGYRNERVIQQMQQTAIASMAAKAVQQGAQGAQGAGNASSTAAETQVAQQVSPTAEQIDQQINQQVM